MWFKPLETNKANYLECFNDCTLIVLTYSMWCFTDMVPEADTRYNVGYGFIVVSLANIAVHLLNMLIETIYRARLSYKRHKYQQRLIDAMN